MRWIYRSSILSYFTLSYHKRFFKTLNALIEMENFEHIEVLDLGNTVNVNGEAAFSFIRKYGHQLKGFAYTGNPKVTEEFWSNSIPHLKKIR